MAAPSRRSAAAVRPYAELCAQISQAARHGYSFYVYALADRSGVFYVGKGTKGRVLCHRRMGQGDRNASKLERIAAAGESLQHILLGFFQDECSAYAYERALIGESPDSLTNISPGQRSPQEIASDAARAILARVVPFEQWMHAAIPGARPLYDRLVAMVKAEIIAPTPRELVFTPSGQVSYGW